MLHIPFGLSSTGPTSQMGTGDLGDVRTPDTAGSSIPQLLSFGDIMTESSDADTPQDDPAEVISDDTEDPVSENTSETEETSDFEHVPDGDELSSITDISDTDWPGGDPDDDTLDDVPNGRPDEMAPAVVSTPSPPVNDPVVPTNAAPFDGRPVPPSVPAPQPVRFSDFTLFAGRSAQPLPGGPGHMPVAASGTQVPPSTSLFNPITPEAQTMQPVPGGRGHTAPATPGSVTSSPAGTTPTPAAPAGLAERPTDTMPRTATPAWDGRDLSARHSLPPTGLAAAPPEQMVARPKLAQASEARSRPRVQTTRGDMVPPTGVTHAAHPVRAAPIATAETAPAPAAVNGGVAQRDMLVRQSSIIEPEIVPELRQTPDGQTALRASSEAVLSRAELPRHLSQQLAEAMQRGGNRPVELNLNPAELGRVKISLQTTEGSVVVHIAADRPETLDLMRRHMDLLAQDFRAIGYNKPEFSFAQNPSGEGSAQFGSNEGRDSHPSDPPGEHPEGESITPSHPALQITDRVDIRV